MVLSLESCAAGAMGGLCTGVLGRGWFKATWRKFLQEFLKKRHQGPLATPLRKATVFLGADTGQETETPLDVKLVNDVMARKWPYISEWFGHLVKDLAGPMIEEKSWQHAKLTACHLGDIPATVSYLENSTLVSDDAGSSIRVECVFEYSGNGLIRVETTAGSLEFRPKLNGTIVIELVKQTRELPWFVGLRIYFPDKPTLEFENFKRPTLLDAAASVMTGERLDTLVLESVKEVICRRSVLPHCFAVSIIPTDDFDPVLLQNLRPNGLLRISMDADFPSTLTYKVGDGASWTSWLTGGGQRSEALTVSVEVTLGASSVILSPGQSHNFVLNEGSWKNICITLRTGPNQQAIRTTQVCLSEVLGQGLCANAVAGKQIHLALPRKDRYFLEKPMCLGASWSPFADSLDNFKRDQCHDTWPAWALVADICHVLDLPPEHRNLNHWAKLRILDEETWTRSAIATTPEQHGHDALRDLYVLPSGFLGEIRKATIPSCAWRDLLHRKGLEGLPKGSDSVDVVWEQSVCCLLFNHALEAENYVEVVIELWRDSAQSQGDKEERILSGTARFPFSKLLDMNGARQDLRLDVESRERDCVGSMGILKLGLQLRPLIHGEDVSRDEFPSQARLGLARTFTDFLLSDNSRGHLQTSKEPKAVNETPSDGRPTPHTSSTEAVTLQPPDDEDSWSEATPRL